MMRNVKQLQLLSRFRHNCLAVSFPSSRYITTTSKSTIHVNAEVQEAIRNRKPVVALESTIITHGMPYPKNLDMANLVEQVIRHHGAIPATIAVINGVFKIGLTASELHYLAKPYDSNLDRDKKKLKISRKDLAYAHASKSDGGTTVAATMILAHKAGIKFFATGGIGGVHRGAEITMDVSTDLTELSKTPVVVVCAGIKSILDIPKTLEVLETYGVPVVTFDSPTFPAFFTNDSGITSPHSIQNIDIIAKMAFTSNHILQLNNGMIVAVPNPDPADSVTMQYAIDQALKEAEEGNISGNQITPFLLARIEQLTEGKSLTSNIALVLNNAKIAAQLAISYQHQVNAHTTTEEPSSSAFESKEELTSSLSSSSVSSSTNSTQSSHTTAATTTDATTTTIYDKNNNNKYIQPVPVMVFGGCVMDIIAKSSQPTFIPFSSNPGVVKFSYGGVGRNIAERMSVDYQTGVSLITVVGEDENGKLLIEHMNSLGVDVTQSIVIKNKDANNNSSSSTRSGVNTNSQSSTSFSSNASTTSNNILNTLQLRYLTSTLSSSPSSPVSTANYLAIHQSDGGLYGGIADMSIFQYLSPDYIRHSNCVGKIRNAALVVSDGNLLPETFTELLKITSSYNIPVFFEPTSDVKCILPITTRTIHLVDVIKPNISELVIIISECLKQQQPPLIKQGIASVQKALNNLQNQHRNNINSNDTSYDNLTDIRILACALQNIMKSSSSSSSFSSSFSLTTAEGRYRKVRGKHVIVSLGARGVIWVGPKSAVTRVRVGESASNRRSSGIATITAAVIVDDVTAMKIFPSIPIPQFTHHPTSSSLHASSRTTHNTTPSITTSHSTTASTNSHINIDSHSNTTNSHMNTNGAGDAFCAGVISSLLDPACDELDTPCILQGLRAAANRIISTN